MTSIFNTYNRNTGDVIIDVPHGCISIQKEYDEKKLNKLPKELLIDNSSIYHPDKFPIIQEQSCYIPKGLLVNNRVGDIYVESAPSILGIKDFNNNVKSNYQLDLEHVVYTDGTRLEGILPTPPEIVEEPQMSISGNGRRDYEGQGQISINDVSPKVPDLEPMTPPVQQQDPIERMVEVQEKQVGFLSELNKAISNINLRPVEDDKKKPLKEDDDFMDELTKALKSRDSKEDQPEVEPRERDEIKTLEDNPDFIDLDVMARRDAIFSMNLDDFVSTTNMTEIGQFLHDLERLDANSEAYGRRQQNRIVTALIKADAGDISRAQLNNIKKEVLKKLPTGLVRFNRILNEYNEYIDNSNLPSEFGGIEIS